ncbi:MAG: NUDIX hydrolase [Candidatus Abyssobacteria bacterium SURF_5]|uniref:NUDIX hydrolase n=1 Tax=Abyssobacteria bacterium (strain SURF_5) TaxID=2093360 RepID=A0A3A4NII1_ABYX5|nr:MAG: NUDIX hydrolase [Candidatus Abyssubacteria bacterium SURF_5]
MYVTQEILADIERKYGVPHVAHFRHVMVKVEFDLLLRSMRYNRAHDITLFISKGRHFVAIRKHMHPEGVFRAPSGGVNPGEDFEKGALREAYEETGATVELVRYILRAQALFEYQDQQVPWVSHVFTARYISGELQPIDTKEIAEVRQVLLEELQGEIRSKMIASGSGGLAYRVALTDKVAEILSATA